MIELATQRITLAPEAMWQVVKDRNPVLWQEIVAMRARIRGETPHA